ncbi:UDP-glucuronosyltransferase 1-8 [Orchesella cincta]|uniref:UDP-glucuronosyltransferase n=1 Tax=Orchesella cincta TaxID=48709 RepID=A0A1D2N8U9_ORCCI|nr:UDP-glucuronosyltransferase 1-8 [Orchesella cincta]
MARIMQWKFLCTVLFLVQNLQITSTKNILFFWGMSGYSHRITIWPLVEKLASSGHNVTFFSPHHPKKPTMHPNITEIVPSNLFKDIGMDYDPAEIRLTGGITAVEKLWPLYLESGVKLCRWIAQDPDILNWLHSDSFDLVVVNGLFNDCGYAIAYKFNASTIAYGTSSLFQWWEEVYGFPTENYPEFHYHLPVNMTFYQQVWNTFTPLYWLALRNWYYLPLLESIIRPALHLADMPSLLELDQRNSLILTNTHFSEEFPRSLPPWIVSVGGMHCTDKTNPLPDNIRHFIESWDNGIIYFSFGTYMKLPLLPQRHKDAIFGAIRKFPSIGFLMKWNGGPVSKDIPENVMTGEWLPQQEILSHPNVRAFISHGGLLGTQEAVFHAVPVIVFPFFAEQDYNAQRIHSAERGIMMEICDLTEAKLENAIREILTNPRYKQNMKQVSQIFRDRPSTPVDTAAWHVEYALRYKDTSFLKPIGLNRTWYERRMLHIWGFVFSVLIAALLLVVILLRVVLSFILNKQQHPEQSNKKIKSKKL